MCYVLVCILLKKNSKKCVKTKMLKKSFLLFLSLQKRLILRIIVCILLSYYCVFLLFLFYGFIQSFVLSFSLLVFLLLRLYLRYIYIFLKQLYHRYICIAPVIVCCTLTMVTSSIFDILLTNMLTRTTAGPSSFKKFQCKLFVLCSFIHLGILFYFFLFL